MVRFRGHRYEPAASRRTTQPRQRCVFVDTTSVTVNWNSRQSIEKGNSIIGRHCELGPDRVTLMKRWPRAASIGGAEAFRGAQACRFARSVSERSAWVERRAERRPPPRALRPVAVTPSHRVSSRSRCGDGISDAKDSSSEEHQEGRGRREAAAYDREPAEEDANGARQGRRESGSAKTRSSVVLTVHFAPAALWS